MSMFKSERIFFSTAAIFLVLLLVAFGYFFVTDAVSMKSADEQTVYSPTPGTTLSLNRGWKSFSGAGLQDEQDLSPDTFRTGYYIYKLTLKTEGMKGQNAFLINPLYSAYILSVNGEIVCETGTPGEGSEKLSLLKSHSVPYLQSEDLLEIEIQVSNSSNLYGGSMSNWISYGRYNDVVVREQQGKILDSLIIFIFLTIAFIHVFNYFFQRKYSHSLFFFLYLFVYALYGMFSGRVIAAYFLPVMSGEFFIRMQYLFMIIAFPIMLNYVRSIYPAEIHGFSVKSVQIIALAVSVSIFIFPLHIARYIIHGYSVLRVTGAVYILFGLVKAARRNADGALWTAVSFSILFICLFNDFLYSLAVISTVRLTFLGMFVFSLHQTHKLVEKNLADYDSAESAHRRLAVLVSQNESFLERNSIELDKPIRNVIELGESLLKGSIGPLNSEQIATSSLIVSNGVRLSNMVNDILYFSSIKEKAIDLNYGPVNLFKISRKVINSCEALVAVKHVDLSIRISRDVKPVYADERRLEQILYNITSNSIRHTAKGQIEIDCNESPDSIEIRISVEGSDFDKDVVEKLFDAYERGIDEGINEQDASDLSLAIAYKLIELHGKEIRVETDGNRLDYLFELDLWTGGEGLSDEEALEMDALINLQPVFDEITSDRNIEVLITGKDVEELQILKSQLSSLNYSVLPMMSGEELLGRVRENAPHLVVMDVKLPDMSGYEVCGEIRKIYSKDELPVILIINKEDISDMMEGLTSGANDFLTRPYLQEEFLTRVNTHLQLSRISNIYSRFVPTEFLRSLGQENILDVELGDQVSREMTILFVDIRAFTNLSENMTPEENFKFINSYLSRFSPMITNNGGFVDKYIGDAIMALFPDKPENALAAAKEMIEHVNVYNGHRANCGYRAINIGIGIHTGNMILGIIGDQKRMQGTVISDAVNLASRIQDVTKLYKANIVISQETFVKLENPMDYNFRFLGRVKVKGKDKAVALFEIFDADDDVKLDKKNRTKADFEEAIMNFSRREFEEAQNLLMKVSAVDPDDKTAKIFMERIEKIRLAEKKDFLTSL